MKALVLLALAGVAPFALANEDMQTAVASEPPVEQYHYGMNLDVAHVISLTDTSSECGMTTSYMIYEDHQGQLHRLAYLVQGGGCSGG